MLINPLRTSSKYFLKKVLTANSVEITTAGDDVVMQFDVPSDSEPVTDACDDDTKK